MVRTQTTKMPKKYCRNWISSVLPLAALTVATLAPASAQFRDEPGEVNFFGGASRFFAYQDHDPRLVLNDGLLFGVRGTWNASKWIAAEGSISYGQNNPRLEPTP